MVRAPRRASDADVGRFVESKRRWIEEHLASLPSPLPKLTHDEIGMLAQKALTVIPERVQHFASIVGVRYGNITIRNQRILPHYQKSVQWLKTHEKELISRL